LPTPTSSEARNIRENFTITIYELTATN
jgi:hypothetical protein